MGPALARRVRQAYGSEAAFIEAAQHLDLDRLLSIDGLSERRAFDLVAHVRSQAASELVRTDRARDVRRDLEDLLASFAQTTYGQRALRLLPTLRDAAAIAAKTSAVLEMRDVAERVDRDAVARALKRLARWREPGRQTLNRLVVCDSEDDELQLRARGIDRWCRLASGEEAARQARDYELVVYAARDGGLALDEADHVVRVKPDDPLWRLIPEAELSTIEANRATLQAMSDLASLVGRASVAPRIMQATLGLAGGRPRDVDSSAQEALKEAERVLNARIGTLSLDGAQILQLLGRGLPQPLAEARAAALQAGCARFQELTGRRADPFADGLPLRLDEGEVERLRAEVEGVAAVRAFEAAQAAARVVAQSREALRDELAAWFQFDADFALGLYARTFHATPALVSHRFRFDGAINLRLARKAAPQPISYEVGGDHPVAVLTGANSGGKTSLLELVAQLAILHHWGLPVPAHRAEIPVLDELLILAGARSADAGALESFLRELFPPVTRPGRKLLLLDEVEAITELEAAGRILGVFLDEIARTDSMCVLVTHLPEEVLRRTRTPVRIDGIDAVGLDERFNLIVDRQPKLQHRARSTPELILRRVHAKAQGQEKAVLARVLQRWDEPS